VSANSTNLQSPRRAGVSLVAALALEGWRYHDGTKGPPSVGRHVAEVYPYTTLVGSAELGYNLERPVYKRRPKSQPVNLFRAARATNCDDLVRRMTALRNADPAIDLMSHEVTRALIEEPSPINDRPYKHREDLIDAVLCAWTGLLWLRHGLARCQVLGADDPNTPVATIIAPSRPEQRTASPTRVLLAGRTSIPD
jgi:predicted RNase H-like nuclease